MISSVMFHNLKVTNQSNALNTSLRRLALAHASLAQAI